MANKRPVIKARTSIASKDNLDTNTNGSNYESTSPQSSSSQNGGEVPFFQIMRPPSNQASSSSSYEEEQQHMTSPPSVKNQSKRSPPAVTPRKHITATVSVTLPQYQYQHSNESHHSTANSVMLSGSNPFIVRNELMTTSSNGGAASRSLDGSSSMFFLSSPSTNHLNRRHTETGRMTVSSSSSYENLNMAPSSSSNHFENDSNGVLRGIFTFEGKTVDLELGDTMIKWKRTNTGKSRSAEATLELKQFYNVQPFIASKSKSQSKQNLSLTSDEDLLNLADGFVLHTFETDQPNSYKHRTLVFLHPHRDTTKLWIDRLKQKLPSQQVEREVLLLINPYTGEKKSRTFLNQTLMPLFSTAQIKLTIVEFHDTLPLRHTLLLNDLVFDNYYGVVVLGGDGSVSKVVNLLIELTIQRDENFDIRENSIESLRDKLKTPLCIIPTGSTNIIANSIYGTTDYNTPLMHLFYGNTIRIDLLCSTTLNSNRLHSFGFGYSCGFGTSLARYMPRFSKLGLKKVQTAIARAVAKQRHRPVEVEIQYIRSRDYQPTDEIRCFKGCTVCQLEQKNVHARKTYDHVEEFDPIANSIEEIQNNLKPIIYNNHRNHHGSSPGGEEDEWEVIQGSFIHIAFLANSHYWDLASAGGLSKYAHLADGCMDLVLVDPVPRKEFFRFIRRHTNGKNQLTLPFVKTIRIKEARIKILNSSSSSGSSASGRPESITSSMGGGAGDDDSFISFKGNSGKQMSMHNFFMADTNMDSSSRGSSRAADSSNKRVTNHFGLSSSSKPPHPPLPPSNTTNTLNGSLSDDSSIDELDLNNNNNDGSSRMDVRSTHDTGISRLPMFNLRRETPPKNNIDLNASLRSSKSPGSGLLKKSRSIVNLFRGDDHNRNNDSRRSSINRSQQQLNDAANTVEYNAFTEYKNSQDKNKLKAPLFTSYPGKNNFTTKSSFKAPSVWNCDWNLNNIPEMNLKCLQKFLPVFGWGLDIETHFDDSAASCLPSF